MTWCVYIIWYKQYVISLLMTIMCNYYSFQVRYCLAVSGKGFISGQMIGKLFSIYLTWGSYYCITVFWWLIAVNYTFYADQRLSGLQPRAQFKNESSSVMTGQVTLKVGGDSPECFNNIIYITVCKHSISMV